MLRIIHCNEVVVGEDTRRAIRRSTARVPEATCNWKSPLGNSTSLIAYIHSCIRTVASSDLILNYLIWHSSSAFIKFPSAAGYLSKMFALRRSRVFLGGINEIRVLPTIRCYSQSVRPLAYDLHEPSRPRTDKQNAPIIFLHGLFGSKKNNRGISKSVVSFVMNISCY